MEQIQIGYNAVHDRLIMSMKAGEETFQLWLTRRFVMQFLAQLHLTTENDPVVQKQTTAPYKSDIMAFQKEQAAMQGKVNKSPQPIQLKLENAEPLLACGIQRENQTLHIQCTNKRRLSLGLSTGLSYGLISLLEQTLKHAGWGFTGVKHKPKTDPEPVVTSNWSVSLN